jgi:beta-lactamase superfamily II metal-dependent hydrolase
MADAGGEVEEALLNSPVNPCASVLIVGRHGHDSATSAAWLDAARPARAIISVGAENQEGLPSPAVIDRLRDRGIGCLRTDEHGTCGSNCPAREIVRWSIRSTDRSRPVRAFGATGRKSAD